MASVPAASISGVILLLPPLFLISGAVVLPRESACGVGLSADFIDDLSCVVKYTIANDEAIVRAMLAWQFAYAKPFSIQRKMT
jgi:hypothetical protein